MIHEASQLPATTRFPKLIREVSRDRWPTHCSLVWQRVVRIYERPGLNEGNLHAGDSLPSPGHTERPAVVIEGCDIRIFLSTFFGQSAGLVMTSRRGNRRNLRAHMTTSIHSQCPVRSSSRPLMADQQRSDGPTGRSAPQRHPF